MIDNTPRWIKIGDALSQLVNVALLPRQMRAYLAGRIGWAGGAYG